MRKLVVSEWVTLDGVFDADTMAQWFNPYQSDDRNEWIRQEILTTGAMLIGRVTYEMFAAYWPAQKNDELGIADRLNSLPKYVVSSTLKKADWNNSTIIKDKAVEEIITLKQQPGQDIVIFGSSTLVQSLMGAGLIDEYRFLVQPIIIGRGKRPFKDGMPTATLKLVETRPFSRGVVLLRYQPEA